MSRPPLSQVEQTYLRSVVELITHTPPESGQFGDIRDPLGDLWIDRSMVPLSRIAGSPPIDDQDSVGLPVAELLDGELGVIRLLVGERGAGKTAITKYLGAVLARQLFGGWVLHFRYLSMPANCLRNLGVTR